MKWNLASDGNLWILKPESVSEVGCIHTCQGLELDYIGVIIGSDFLVRNGEVVVDPASRAKTDSSIKGYKKLLKENPEAARRKAEAIIKNTYRTLMTRGVKGCYVFCTDAETNEYFKTLGNFSFTEQDEYRHPVLLTESNPYDGLSLRILPHEEVKPFVNAVPVYDLKVAAGQFSEEQEVHEVSSMGVEDCDWVELTDAFRPQPDLFIAQVVGESMNRRIPNGAWCLFRLNPAGTRNGKIVLVQHRDIQDYDTGGQYTVKVYRSEKRTSEDGGWEHSCIQLCPDSSIPEYEPLVFDEETAGELKVIAELVAVLC